MHIVNGNKMALSLLVCAGLFSAASQAVNIDITGKVVASPCIVNGNNDSLAVSLGDNIQADSLATSGSATTWADVTLRLTSCPASTTSDTDTNYYKNTGTATNLKLELTDSSSNSAYKNGAKLENVAIPTATHAYDLVMRARAVSIGSVMPGTIVGQVQATFTYQ